MNYTKLGDFYYRLAAPIFERVRDFQIPISVGSDLHEELDLLDEVDDALSFIQELHLEKNLKLFLKEIGKRYEG